eukprot:6404140-Alexandrium_andersonii.AAC.1
MSVKDSNGVAIHDGKQIATMWRNHYSSKLDAVFSTVAELATSNREAHDRRWREHVDVAWQNAWSAID